MFALACHMFLSLSQVSPIHVLRPVSWRSILMLSTLLCLVLPNCVSLFGFPEQRLSTTHFLVRATYSSYLIVWFPKQYFVKSRDFDPHHNIIFFVPVLRFHFSPRYSQHPILTHPQPMFLPPCERPGFIPVYNSMQLYSSVYFTLYIFG